MHSIRRAVQSIARSCRDSRAGLTMLAGAMVLVTCWATTAGAQTPPTIDGNNTDLIQFANDLLTNVKGIGIVQADAAGELQVTDPLAVPCPPIVNNYYVNGFDQIQYVVAQASGSSTLYLGIRAAGVIGDTDGNGSADDAGGAGCNPQDNISDLPGIGADESYTFYFDTNCGAQFAPTATINITGDKITGTGLFSAVSGSVADGSIKYVGHDLEIKVLNAQLPNAFKVRTIVGSIPDGLAEDFGPIALWQPHPNILITKSADPARICVGKSTRFTLTVTNTGDCDLSTAVEDDLPPGITFAGNVSTTCNVGAPQVNGSAVIWPAFNLPFGASCTISFDALAGPDCIGTVTNHAHADGAVTGPCVNQPPAHSETTFDVTCVSLPCVTAAAQGPPAACAGTTVTIQGSVTSCSKDPETVVVTVNGTQAFNGPVAAGASSPWSIDLTMPQCTPGQNVPFVVHVVATGECGTAQAQDQTVNVLCKNGPCVQAGAACDAGNGATAACPGTPIAVTGSGQNCSTDAEDITVTIEGQAQTFTAVPAGQTVSWVRTIPMPVCTSGQQVAFHVTATATNTCGSTKPSDAQCTILCQTPQVEISKVASPAGSVDQGTKLTYTITVTNPSKTVGLDNVVVTDNLCANETYQGNATPATATAPTVGTTGTITWNLGSLAPGAVSTITFDAQIVTLPSPACQATDLSCTNNVSVVGNCADAQATANGSYTTPILPCPQTSLCRLTGGGCLNENGGTKGHKQSTFGGNASPDHTGGGPTGNSWEHVYRDGKTILFNWHSPDAHVIACSDVTPGPCSPKGTVTRADFVGTGQYSIGAGGRNQDGNMVAYIIDHTEGACNKNVGDYYSIVVRTGLVIGSGDIVFQTAGTIDCGNLQIHQTPARLFGGQLAPGEGANLTTSVALLNRAYPNPFSGSTTFAYKVSNANTRVDVGVYNVAGRLVKTLDSGLKGEGTVTLTWNGTDEAGVKMAPGVYFLRSRVGAESTVERVIYLSR